MTPVIFSQYTKSVREQIIFMLSAHYEIFICDIEEILNIVNPIFTVELNDGRVTGFKIVNKEDRLLFESLILNLKKAVAV